MPRGKKKEATAAPIDLSSNPVIELGGLIAHLNQVVKGLEALRTSLIPTSFADGAPTPKGDTKAEESSPEDAALLSHKETFEAPAEQESKVEIVLTADQVRRVAIAVTRALKNDTAPVIAEVRKYGVQTIHALKEEDRGKFLSGLIGNAKVDISKDIQDDEALVEFLEEVYAK